VEPPVSVVVVGTVVVVVVAGAAHVWDRLKNGSLPRSRSSRRRMSASPDSNVSSVDVKMYACASWGGPNVVNVTVPAVANSTVKLSKMFPGLGAPNGSSSSTLWGG
jgi:hypothetical protein